MSRQLQFTGYLNTPTLWLGEGPMGLNQLYLKKLPTPRFIQSLDGKYRLGNLVERFVTAELKEYDHIEILAENLQIQRDKLTLGELDCLLRIDGRPIHLEVIYKFYLYDPQVGITALDHWIGPNRRDSLVLKLNKLANKQLPLLYKPETEAYLNALDLKADQMQQLVCFKAQLYLPFGQEVNVAPLNPESIYGSYISFEGFSAFIGCKCYFPRKHDWLVKPHTAVDWVTFEQAQERLQEFHEKQSAPLVWIKQPSGLMEKVFVVWWNQV
ncbi:DUF1853 family protein [Gilvibacter sediminis]|uniref:DUF1853 family protein n=1 Tax=Gilvibacter sediminis TaxID=379071 RepID=UPI0023505EEC|nr:DUF1853 family protein [Gilvibacter sediminis]MDC7998306.1 DUF1853 family protein [Gilvibacter sediminis]